MARAFFRKQPNVRLGGLMRLRSCLVAGLCLLVLIQAAGQTSIFVVPPQYAVGVGPVAIAVGDFNGDGKPDLAVSNNCPASGCGLSDSSTVSILLGNGDGTFQPHVDYLVGSPSGLAVADFNGDGKLDLAVANNGSVAILLGNGDGTFQTAVDYATPGTTSSVAVGDFNGDGKPDLVVTNSDQSTVSVFLNSGSGTFPTRMDFATGSFPTSVAVGDFNGDGKLDLATTECGNSANCDALTGPSSVSILLGNGDGTFQAHVDYTVGIAPVAMVVADLNGDGFLDLAVVNSGAPPDGTPGSVSVLYGNGTGTFQTQQIYPAGLGPLSIVVGDFNGDGKLDFAVTDEGDLGVYLNQGNSSFSQPTVLYGTGGFASAAATGDFNGDQKLDVAVPCDNANIFGVCILLGQGNGSFSPTSLSYPTGSDPDAVAVADLNGDSKNDIAVANFNDNNVGVFLGNGDGTVQPPVNYSTGTGPSALAIADVNGDGQPDLVVANQTANTVSVLLNNGDGTFLTHVDYATATGPVSVAIGDLNGDGKLDLAVACGNNVSVLFGNGDGTFQGHIDYGAGAASIVLGDFNGDGKLDFAVVDNAEVTLFLNNGSGGFGATAVPLASLRVPAGSQLVRPSRLRSKDKTRPNGAIADLIITDYTTIAAADFNSDGKLDLVVSGAGGSNDAGLLILLGNGDGTFQAPISLDSPPGNSIAIADFNGDGILDVALGTPDEDVVALSLGNGDGTFRTALEYAAGFASVAAGDLNGDGKPDLASTSGPEGAVNGDLLTILLNTGQVASSFKLAASPASQTVSDWNSATLTVTGTTTNGFTGTVTLTCRLLLGEGSTCTAKPSSIIPTASGASSTVTVTTNASTVVGTYALTVTGTSGIEQFTVNASVTVTPAVPAFGVSAPAAGTPSSVMPGQPSTATVTVGSSGGFAGTVAFTCSVSPMPTLAPTCSLSPAQVPVTAGGQATSTLNINTTGPTAFLVRPSLLHGGSPIYAVVFPIFGLALMGLRFTLDGRGKKTLGLVISCLLLGSLLLQAACGGGSSTTSTSTPGTPAGSYTVTVVGSSGSAQHETVVNLTVQ
jgi:hypothetical protein